MAAVENLDAVIDLEVALLDAGLDAGDVEDGDPVHRARRHFGQRHAFFGIVAGREGVFTLIVRVAIVEVAVDDHLPAISIVSPSMAVKIA